MYRLLGFTLSLCFSFSALGKDKKGSGSATRAGNAFTWSLGQHNLKLPNLVQSLTQNGFQEFQSKGADRDVRLSSLGVDLSVAPYWVPLNIGFEFMTTPEEKTEMTSEGYQAALSQLGYRINFVFAMSRGFLNIDLRGSMGYDIYSLELSRLTNETHPLFFEDSRSASFLASSAIYGYTVEAYIVAYRNIKLGARAGIEKSTAQLDFSTATDQIILGSDYYQSVVKSIIFGWAF